MAVFTPIDKPTLEAFLDNYDLGKIKNFEGILEGIDNTNYKILTSNNYYILTIFEKRIQEKDLPFFINLQNHLAKKKFLNPKPIKNKEGKYISQIKNKPCVIMSFLEGSKTTKVSTNHCGQVGKQLAIMHEHTRDFLFSRQNSLQQKNWKILFEKFKNNKKNPYKNIFESIEKELDFLDQHWPKKLPFGVIHADVFQDNVFFINDVFSGIIDFYFACNDFFAYDLAICINAWCFEQNSVINSNKLTTLVNEYQKNKQLTEEEIVNLPILLRGATTRILLTRLYDQIYHPKDAFVKPKDPMEFYRILEFYQKNKDQIINNGYFT